MLSKEKKQEIIEEYRKHQDDTGSAQLQVALLTHKINELTDHLRDHPHDHHSRRGLLKMVGKRKRLMNYLEDNEPEQFEKLREELNIRIRTQNE